MKRNRKLGWRPWLRTRRSRVVAVALILMLIELPEVSHAQVVTDISPSGDLGTIVDPPRFDFGEFKTFTDIKGGTRPGGGPNLFHSFGNFSIAAGEVANLLNDSGLATTNILSRVTGGNPSSIFGEIRTNGAGGFGNANLFLMNPAGMVFGPGATLNVGGSAAFVTADRINFTDIGAAPFELGTPANALTMSPVASFGFLPGNPAAIAIQGSTLKVPASHSLTFVGGARTFTDPTDPMGAVPAGITMKGGKLSAPGGQVKLVSVQEASADTTVISPVQDPTLQVQNVVSLGQVTLEEDATLDAGAAPGTPGFPPGCFSFFCIIPPGPAEPADGHGGTVVIRSGQLMVDASTIKANTVGNIDGALFAIDLDVEGMVTLTNGASLSVESGGTFLAPATGAGGEIRLNVGYLTIEGGSSIITQHNQGGLGEAKGVTVTASDGTDGSMDSVVISGENSRISTDTLGNKTGGKILVSGPSLRVEDGGTLKTGSNLAAPGGGIEVDVRRLVITNASITTDTGSTAASGKITVKATDKAELSGSGCPGGLCGLISSSDSTFFGGASPGDIEVSVANLSLSDGAVIQSGDILAGGQGGNVTIQGVASPAESVVISNGSSISSAAFQLDAGEVKIEATDLTLSDGSIRTSTKGIGNAGVITLNAGMLEAQGGSRIESTTDAVGNAGSITANVGTLSLTGNSVITSSSTGAATGDAGSVTIQGLASPADSVTLTNSSLLTSTAGPGQGGNINISGQNVLFFDGSTVSASSTGPAPDSGNAGNITIAGNITFDGDGKPVTDPGTLLRLENSEITSTADVGGGNITVDMVVEVVLVTSTIATTVKSDADLTAQAGNIKIDPLDVILLRNSHITADADVGRGGNVTIVATQVFFADATSDVTATATRGISGEVDIRSPIQDLSGTLAPLPESGLQAAALLMARCAAKLQGGQSSSFVQVGRDSLPPEPGGWLPSPLLAMGERGAALAQAGATEPDGIFGVSAQVDDTVQLRRVRHVGPLAALFPLYRVAVCG